MANPHHPGLGRDNIDPPMGKANHSPELKKATPSPIVINEDEFDLAEAVREELPTLRAFVRDATAFVNAVRENIYVVAPDPEQYRAGRPGFPREDGARVAHRSADWLGRRLGHDERRVGRRVFPDRGALDFIWGLVESDGIHLT